MITNPVAYSEPQLHLVNIYNSTPNESKNPNYWESTEVTPIRGAIKTHYEKEQKFRCCYCGVELKTSHGRVWDAEHIVPKAERPDFLFEPLNLAVSCIDCNTAKSDQAVLANKNVVNYPRKSEGFTIVHPHFDNLDDHIGVLLERFYFPKTRKGERTIHVCRLLRYAYELFNWDEAITDSSALLDSFNGLMDSSDENAQKIKMMEIMVISQVRTSRTLLSSTPGLTADKNKHSASPGPST